MKTRITASFILLLSCIFNHNISACTGISLTAKDGSRIVARTIEWGGSKLPSMYVIVPRGTEFTSYTPTGINGLTFKAKYGLAGLSVVQKEFITEGMNEAGLSAGLFYFPGYGQYPDFDSTNPSKTIADLQVVCWILSQHATVDEVKESVKNLQVTVLQGASTVHWRVADSSGRQIVIEFIDGRAQVYDNPAGVLTNSPGFPWQMTNLNNYVNLYPGAVAEQSWNNTSLRQFGAGAGFLGLPGDVTPPSRFVRAFFYQATAPQQPDGEAAVVQAFHILNNFDIPVGLEHKAGEAPDIPSATQWTAAADMTNGKLYYRTMYNSTVRCIDLRQIDFSKTKFAAYPLDKEETEPIEHIKIK